MDYSTEKYALIKNQWNLIHNPQTTTGLFDDMEEGAMVQNNDLSTSDYLLQLLYEIRMNNIKKNSSIDISNWRKLGLLNFSTFKIKSLDISLTNIHFQTIGDTADINTWGIITKEKNINETTHPVSTVTGAFVKYSFYQNGTNTAALEITVSKADTTIFNKYLYPSEPAPGVKLGDPKPNISVTTTNTNSTYGYLGCVRTGGSDCPYPDSYKYSGKGKKHDGVDITATVGENVYAILGGVVQGNPVTSFEPQNPLYANSPDKDYRGLLSDQKSTQIYTYTKSNGQLENDTLPAFTKVGWYGCHYAEGSYGNTVTIKVVLDKPVNDIYGNPKSTIYIRYCHMNTISVTNGQRVEQGAIIGTAGCSGNAARLSVNEHHIHIEANSTNDWTGARDIDPNKIMTTIINRP